MDFEKVIKDLKKETYIDKHDVVDLSWVYANEFLEKEELSEEISEADLIDLILKYEMDGYFPFNAYKFIYKGEVDPITIIAAYDLDPNQIKQELEDEAEYDITFEKIQPNFDEVIELDELDEEWKDDFDINRLAAEDRENRLKVQYYLDSFLENVPSSDAAADPDLLGEFAYEGLMDMLEIEVPEDFVSDVTVGATMKEFVDYLDYIGWTRGCVIEYIKHLMTGESDLSEAWTETPENIKKEQELFLQDVKDLINNDYTYYAHRYMWNGGTKAIKQPVRYHDNGANAKSVKFEFNTKKSEDVEPAYKAILNLLYKHYPDIVDYVEIYKSHARAPYIRIRLLKYVDADKVNSVDLTEKKKKRKKETNMSIYPVLGVGYPLFKPEHKDDDKPEDPKTIEAPVAEVQGTEVAADAGASEGGAMAEGLFQDELPKYVVEEAYSGGIINHKFETIEEAYECMRNLVNDFNAEDVYYDSYIVTLLEKTNKGTYDSLGCAYFDFPHNGWRYSNNDIEEIIKKSTKVDLSEQYKCYYRGAQSIIYNDQEDDIDIILDLIKEIEQDYGDVIKKNSVFDFTNPDIVKIDGEPYQWIGGRLYNAEEDDDHSWENQQDVNLSESKELYWKIRLSDGSFFKSEVFRDEDLTFDTKEDAEDFITANYNREEFSKDYEIVPIERAPDIDLSESKSKEPCNNNLGIDNDEFLERLSELDLNYGDEIEYVEVPEEGQIITIQYGYYNEDTQWAWRYKTIKRRLSKKDLYYLKTGEEIDAPGVDLSEEMPDRYEILNKFYVIRYHDGDHFKYLNTNLDNFVDNFNFGTVAYFNDKKAAEENLKYANDLLFRLEGINPEEEGVMNMNIIKVEDIVGKNTDLSEDIEKHDTLNPALWNEDKSLKPEVREAILKIVDQFVKNLNEDGVQLAVADIVLLGSNASYNYTKDSDIDVHILADEKFDCDEKHLPIIYNAYKSLFNNKYDITINGFEVELYVEDVDKVSAVSNGIYSVKQDKWLKEPTQLTIPDLNKEEFEKEFKKWEDKYFEVINTENLDEELVLPNDASEEIDSEELEKFIRDREKYLNRNYTQHVIRIPGGAFSRVQKIFTDFEEAKKFKNSLEEKNRAMIEGSDAMINGKYLYYWTVGYDEYLNDKEFDLSEGYRKGEATLSEIIFDTMESLKKANVLSLDSVKKIIRAEDVEASDADIEGIYEKFINMFGGEE